MKRDKEKIILCSRTAESIDSVIGAELLNQLNSLYHVDIYLLLPSLAYSSESLKEKGKNIPTLPNIIYSPVKKRSKYLNKLIISYSKFKSRFWMLVYSIMQLKHYYSIFKKREDALKATAGYDCRPYCRLMSILNSLYAVTPAYFISRFILFSLPSRLSRIKPNTYSFALVTYNAFSVNGFTDEFIHACSEIKLPTFGIQHNLDNVPNRVPLVKPDHLLVWSLQSYLSATSTWKYPFDKVDILAPQRLSYISRAREARFSTSYHSLKSDARKKLGLKATGYIYLYAPSSRAHKEELIKETLLKFQNDNCPEHSISIISKGIPSKLPEDGPNAPKSELSYNSNSIFPIDDIQKQWANGSQDFYYNLMLAVDGVISPFSTIMYEAMGCGLPVLGISADKQDIPIVNPWSYITRANYHIQFWSCPHNICCDDVFMLERSLYSFTELIKHESSDWNAFIHASIERIAKSNFCIDTSEVGIEKLLSIINGSTLLSTFGSVAARVFKT